MRRPGLAAEISTEPVFEFLMVIVLHGGAAKMLKLAMLKQKELIPIFEGG